MVKSKAKPAAHKTARKSEKDSTHKKSRPSAKKFGSAESAATGSHRPGDAAPSTNGHAHPTIAPGDPQLAQAQQTIGSFKSASGVELAEKVKELLRLAQEQGYLTYNDINDALPDNIVSPEDLDEIYIKLRNLDVEIVDQ